MSETDDLYSDEAETEKAGGEMPMPPVTFEFFVVSLKMQADMSLGLLHFGEEKDRPKPDFRAARYSIDLLGLLADKTKGNLTLEEQRVLENSLTELRFRYVQLLESSNKPPEDKAESNT